MEGTKERNREGPTVVRALRLQRATCVAPDSTSGDHASTFPVGLPTPSHMVLVSCLVLEAVTRWVYRCLQNEGGGIILASAGSGRSTRIQSSARRGWGRSAR